MISIYCSEKLDGVLSSAVVLRHAKLAKLPAHFAGYLHPYKLNEELADIASTNHIIFFLDIPFSPDHLPALEQVASCNKILYATTTDLLSVIPPAQIFDRSLAQQSSTEIVQQRFLPHDQVAKTLAQLAHQLKFWQLTDERAPKLADLIAFGFDPITLLDTLSRGIFWNNTFETFSQNCLSKKNHAIEELFKTLVIKTYLTYRFGFALVNTTLSSADACQKLLDGHAGIDVAVAVYTDGTLALRSRSDCPLDVSSLAQLFLGGGLPFAAGAKLANTITKATYPDRLFQLDQTFRTYFLGNV